MTMTATKQISFKATKQEYELIGKIVDRAEAMANEHGLANFDARATDMDLTACHANGCPLDFQKLLEFDDSNFGHDVFGITRFIDRKTGELGDCFLPRCARPE